MKLGAFRFLPIHLVMFEDTTNYDFWDDTWQTSFASSSSNEQTDVMRQGTNNEIIRKRMNNSENSMNKENFKKPKLEISRVSLIENIKNSPMKPVERKFPGPAGLLPDICDNINKSISEILHDDNIEKSEDPEIFLCSQQQLSVFEKGPWQTMALDFQDSQRDLLYETFNINWIKANFSEKKQLNYKAPFLACTIDKLELTDGKIPTVKIVLKDKTGTIQGTILYSLYDEYSNYFTVGSVLVLIQFGVLSAQKSHCLTITPNNLLTIYHLDITESSKGDKNATRDTNVRKIVLQQYSIESIWKKHHESYSYTNHHRKEISFKNLHNFDSRNQVKYKNPNTHFPSFNSRTNMRQTIFNKPIRNDLPVANVEITNQNPVSYKNVREEEPAPTRSTSNSNSNTSFRQISFTSDNIHSGIWNDLFQGVDTDALFEDF